MNILFWKKFTRFLLLGLSLMVLSAGSWQMISGDVLHRGPDSVLALEDDCLDPGNPGCPEPGGGGQVPGEPVPPVQPPPVPPAAPVCVPRLDFVRNECIGCGRSRSVVANSCTGEETTSSQQDDVLCSATYRPELCPAPPQPTAPEAPPIFGSFYCDIPHTCNNGSNYQLARTVTTNGVVTYETKCDTNQCPISQPPAPQPTAVPTAVPSAACLVCDNFGFADGQGRWRQGFNCGSGLPACQVNNSSTFGGCTGAAINDLCATTQAIVPTQPPVPIPTQPARIVLIPLAPRGAPIINNNNPSITNDNRSSASTGSVNITVQQPQTPAFRQARVVLASGATTTTTTAESKVPVQTLPKTGLPFVAWSLAGLLPIGARLKKFGGLRQNQKDSPTYLWQKREFDKSDEV